jgi:hypothetical protein
MEMGVAMFNKKISGLHGHPFSDIKVRRVGSHDVNVPKGEKSSENGCINTKTENLFLGKTR